MFFTGRAAKIIYRSPLLKTEKTSLETSSKTEKIKETIKSVLPNVKSEPLRSLSERDVKIGVLGILHPTVLENFDLTTPKPYPVAVVEWNVERFM
jgi:phenylalanyl-tRNA synthetase beta chain